MNKVILSAVMLALSAPVISIPASAGIPGASPLGQNPDQYVTIAEREQRQRQRLSGKIKSLYGDSSQRLIAIEEDKWFVKQQRKKGNKNFR